MVMRVVMRVVMRMAVRVAVRVVAVVSAHCENEYRVEKQKSVCCLV